MEPSVMPALGLSLDAHDDRGKIDLEMHKHRPDESPDLVVVLEREVLDERAAHFSESGESK
jgi:hypothetical protein